MIDIPRGELPALGADEVEVSAERFGLRDKQGRPRAVLSMDEPAIPGGEPEPVLVMIDWDGQPRISITLTSGNLQIVLSRCKQRPGSASDHEPRVLLSDEDWLPLVEIAPEPPTP